MKFQNDNSQLYEPIIEVQKKQCDHPSPGLNNPLSPREKGLPGHSPISAAVRGGEQPQ
jgi:hypothetical protein